MNQYYAIHRTGDNDIEHQRFKYISKKKVNGKWRYYYDGEDAAGNKGVYYKVTGDKDSQYGTYRKERGGKYGGTLASNVTVSKGNKLLTKKFGKQITKKGPNGVYQETINNIKIGKLERLSDDIVKKAKKGKKFIDDLFDR